MDTTLSMTSIWPMTIVSLTAFVVLLGDSCLPSWRKLKSLNPAVSLLGIALAAISSLRLMTADQYTVSSLFNGAISADTFAQVFNLLLLVSAAIAVFLATTYLETRGLNLGEYYVLILFSTAGAMLMAAATDLIVLFIALETLSVALYVLAGFARTEERSEEAALKYFLLGAFAAGFLLYGIALIYGGSATATLPGTTNLTHLTAQLMDGGATPMLMTGVVLVLVGLGFKAALVPFHMWTPDVYEGAPTSVTAYMAATAKIGAFAALLRVFHALAPISAYWVIAIEAIAVLTMFGGNIMAVTQDNVKRILAYSSIANAGYLLVTVVAATDPKAQSMALGAAAFYLLAYTLMTMGAFAVLIWLSRRGKDCATLDDLKGLARTDPVAAYTMLIFMLSLGGIPPTMGFMGKWLIFSSALKAGFTGMAISLALASAISIYYYLKVVWVMCFQEPEGAEVSSRLVSPGGVYVALLATCGLSVLFGILPNALNVLMEAANMPPTSPTMSAERPARRAASTPIASGHAVALRTAPRASTP